MSEWKVNSRTHTTSYTYGANEMVVTVIQFRWPLLIFGIVQRPGDQVGRSINPQVLAFGAASPAAFELPKERRKTLSQWRGVFGAPTVPSRGHCRRFVAIMTWDHVSSYLTYYRWLNFFYDFGLSWIFRWLINRKIYGALCRWVCTARCCRFWLISLL